jgi:hypothetical protein
MIQAEGNSAPVADAGDDQNANVGTRVNLDGGGSYDPDNDPLGYSWAMIYKPNGSSAQLNGENTVDTSLTPDQTGQYVIQLIVDDGKITSDPDTVMITAEGEISPCDLNRDGNVDIDDYRVIRSILGRSEGDVGFLDQADYDDDGYISLADYQKWSMCYREHHANK